MANNAPLPKAEANVVVRNFGTEAWRSALSFDPITLPVEIRDLDTTDVFDEGLMRLVDAIVEIDTHPRVTLEYLLVWSATGRAVKGVCPACDDVFTVSKGVTHIFGYNAAVQCGCMDK